MRISTGILAGALLLAAAAPALALNEGFETGGQDFLSLHFPGGTGEVEIVSSFAGNTSVYAPAHGQYFLDLEPGIAGGFVGIHQTYLLQAGDTVTGKAAFVSRDSLPNNDVASVVVRTGSYNITGPILATPWSADVAGTGANTDGPWTPWSFTAPADGAYTIELRVANMGDAADSSHALFDAFELDIDIKPGSTDNEINPAGPGVFPVATLTTPDFDVQQIDRSSVHFGAAGSGGTGLSFPQDIDHDGDTDLVSVFKTSRSQILCWSKFGFLSAKLHDGRLVSGSDTITPVGSSCP